MASLAVAQPERADESGWSFEVGGGILTAPAFPGADHQQVMLVPDVRAAYGERFSASIAQGARYTAWAAYGWAAGPLATVDFGRDADGDSPFRIAGDEATELTGIHEVDAAVQAGAFLRYETETWSAEAVLQRALGGHEGLVLDLSLDRSWRLTTAGGLPLIVGTGPRLRWASADYLEAYFGLTAADAAASGLSRFQPGAGLVSAGWGLQVVRPVSRRAAIIAFLAAERLLGDAADSPLVSRRGDANQLSAGIFFSYRL
ncbi:MAG: MipA/OmpV family protein [Cephaloticoccus sp.]